MTPLSTPLSRNVADASVTLTLQPSEATLRADVSVDRTPRGGIRLQVTLHNHTAADVFIESATVRWQWLSEDAQVRNVASGG
ncbi:MAG TPA: hypothetical protein VL069_04550, partial [Opitutus sp.]|nr:hypothetical protein [Opitutus sp.]